MLDKVTIMNSWVLSPLIEIRSINPEDTNGLKYFYLLGLQHAMVVMPHPSLHGVTLYTLKITGLG